MRWETELEPELPNRHGAPRAQGEPKDDDPNAARCNAAAPGCAAVYQLVAQHIQTVEQHGEHPLGVHLADRAMRGRLAARKRRLPVGFVYAPVLKVPERH